MRARVLDGEERVHRLAGLADRDDERAGPEERLAVLELVRELDVDGDPRPGLDRVPPDLRGVGRRACGDEDDPLDPGEHLVGEHAPEIRQRHEAVASAPEERVRDRLRLLADLLRHEPRPAALVGGARVPGDLVLVALDLLAREVGDLDAVRADRDDLVLTDRDRALRVLDERRDIAPEGSSPPRRARRRAASSGGRRRRRPARPRARRRA